MRQAVTKPQHVGALLLIFNLTVWRFLLQIIKIMWGEADSQPTSSPRQHKKVELPSRLRCAIVDELCSQHRPACQHVQRSSETASGELEFRSSRRTASRGKPRKVVPVHVGEWWYSSMHSQLGARWGWVVSFASRLLYPRLKFTRWEGVLRAPEPVWMLPRQLKFLVHAGNWAGIPHLYSH